MGVIKKAVTEVKRQVNVKGASKKVDQIRKEEIDDKRKSGKEGKN